LNPNKNCKFYSFGYELFGKQKFPFQQIKSDKMGKNKAIAGF